MVLFKNCIWWPCPASKMAAMASDWLKNWKSLKIFFRTTEWHETKVVPNTKCSPRVVLFQKCIRWPHKLSKMGMTDYGHDRLWASQIMGISDYAALVFPALSFYNIMQFEITFGLIKCRSILTNISMHKMIFY